MPTSRRQQRNFITRIFMSPEELRLRAGWRLFGHIVLLIPVSIVITYPLAWLSNISPNLASASSGPTSNLLVITLSVYLARRLLDRRSFSSLGLRWDSQAVGDILLGIGITALMMAFIFVSELTFGWLRFEGFAWEQKSTFEITTSLSSWAFIFLFVGWYEELLSRGYQLQNLADGLNMPLAVFLSSSIFAFAHYFNPHASWISTLGILVAGYFLAYGYLRTNQLWLSIGLHIGWNFFEGPVFGFPVSGMNTSPLLLHSAQGPEIITGGAFGPEAGLILLPAVGLGAYLIYKSTLLRNA
ncbi:MAG: CPBP family intramembrane metalloprotease [Chloroflexi bacterium]|nr:CPBP family intramembrane metalloprotease [Chloroflexota bacterium]